MKRFGIGVLFGIGGYTIAAIAGYFLLQMLSGNTHDREVEAAMTSVFFFGPIGGIAAFIAGMAWGKRFSASSNVE
jgi:hypothetical protein